VGKVLYEIGFRLMHYRLAVFQGAQPGTQLSESPQLSGPRRKRAIRNQPGSSQPYDAHFMETRQGIIRGTVA
jgi:hypothetical protein